MPDRRIVALTACLLTILLAAGGPLPAATLEHVGTHVWRDRDSHFGGFSAIEISADGSGFHALSDRAQLFWGSIERDPEGRIRAMNIAGRAHLKDSAGKPLKPGYQGDSEGLAIAPDGTIWVSFEGLNRVARYDHPDATATREPRPPRMRELRINSGMESLAILPDGTLMSMPEDSLAKSAPFPVLHFKDGEWSQPYTIRRDGNWLPVGSDYGPDDWFYLLERGFHGMLGFSSRVRRMRLTPTGPVDEEILLETRPMQYDNLEGISAWHDGQGVRLTMISDDNFLFVQRTELVEYRVIEDEAAQD